MLRMAKLRTQILAEEKEQSLLERVVFVALAAGFGTPRSFETASLHETGPETMLEAAVAAKIRSEELFVT